MPEDSQQDGDEPQLEAQLSQVLARLTYEITEEQKMQVLKRLKHSAGLAKKVGATPMSNADEPEIVFQPFRRQER